MREPKTRTIDGLEYTVAPLMAGVGLPVMTELAQMIGPAIAQLRSLDELDASVFPALGELIAKLDGVKLVRICRTFADQTTVGIDGKTPQLSKIFDIHFAANYMALCEFAIFAAEVNGFSSFLRQVAEAFAARTKTQSPTPSGSPSPSPPASSGVSGAVSPTGDFIAR